MLFHEDSSYTYKKANIFSRNIQLNKHTGESKTKLAYPVIRNHNRANKKYFI